MSESVTLRLALWIARRNGRALAQSLAAQYRAARQRVPDSLEAQRWQELLDRRSGWEKIRTFVYGFRTGARVELKAQADASQILDWVAAVELQPLTRGFRPELKDRLLKESLQAARDHWSQEMAKGKE